MSEKEPEKTTLCLTCNLTLIGDLVIDALWDYVCCKIYIFWEITTSHSEALCVHTTAHCVRLYVRLLEATCQFPQIFSLSLSRQPCNVASSRVYRYLPAIGSRLGVFGPQFN